MFDVIFTKISAKYYQVDFLRMYQTLDLLHQNARKLSEFVGLVTISTAARLKKFENYSKGSKWGTQFSISQPELHTWNKSILNDRHVKPSE